MFVRRALLVLFCLGCSSLAACSDGGGASDASTEADAGDAASLDASADDASPADATAQCDPSENGCVLSVWVACVEGAIEHEPCAYGCGDTGCNTTCDPAEVVIDHLGDFEADDIDHAGSGDWQSFEVDETGVLTALELKPNLYSPLGEPFSLTLSIYAGEGIEGALITQEPFTRPSVSASPPDVFTFAIPVPLQAGQTYTWRLEGAVSIYYSRSDTYPNGRASHPSRDMLFKAYVAACR